MGKKILLADDSITIQKVIELTFSDEDFDVVTVGNGRLAIERLPEVQPDIVLCDIIMPEKDGYEVCEHIKGNPATAHVPVLLLTGAFEPFDQDRAARVGSDGHLAKPFEPQTLISKVKELLSRSGRPSAGAVPTVAIPPPPPAASVPPPLPPAAAALPLPPMPSPASEIVNPTRPMSFSAPTAPPPPPAAASEVTFIPEEPYGMGGPASDASVGQVPEYGVSSDDFYGVTEQPVEMSEFDPEPQVESIYSAEAGGAYGADEVLTEAVEVPEAAALEGAGVPWAQPTVEVSWETRAQVASEAPQAFTDAPVFDEVFDPGAVGMEAPAVGVPPPSSQAEPLSIPPMLLEYDSSFEAPAADVPSAYAPASPVRHAGSTAADFLEEQAMTFEADDLASAEPPAVAEGRLPSPAAPTPVPQREPALAREVSFADVAAVAMPPATPSAPAASVAAEVPVPMDMVAQIAQRVVGQLSEKVIREVAWEILPDLAEALITKEIDRLTAELKEP